MTLKRKYNSLKIILNIEIFLVLLLGISCSFSGTSHKRNELGPNAGFERRRVEEYFVSSGVERYFLPEVPYWANFNEEAQCRRKTSIKFFNMDSLRSSLRLSYEESIHLQLMFNHEIQKLKKDKGVSHIPFDIEEDTFYKVSDRIQAGIRIFRKPSFKRVNIIWIDPYVNNEQELAAKLQEPQMYKGHPVFVSLCMTYVELEEWMKKSGLGQKNIRLMSYELLTPYTNSGKLDTSYHLDFDEVLKNKKKYIYIKKGWNIPSVFNGNFKTQKL